MTTEPNSIVVFPSWIHSAEAFWKAHERIIIIGLASLLLWHFGDKGLGMYDKYQLGKQSADNQAITQIHNDNVNLQKQIAQMQLDFQVQLEKDKAAIVKKKQAVIVQQKIDAALPLPELSSRWETLLVLAPGSITPQPNGTIAISSDAAHSTVNELEKVPQLVDENVRLAADLQSCTDIVSKKDEAITGKQTEIDAISKARAQDAVVAKDKERHAFWRGFKWGFVTGVATAVALKVAAVVK